MGIAGLILVFISLIVQIITGKSLVIIFYCYGFYLFYRQWKKEAEQELQDEKELGVRTPKRNPKSKPYEHYCIEWK